MGFLFLVLYPLLFLLLPPPRLPPHSLTAKGSVTHSLGRMYALASLRCPLVSAAFAWQTWNNVHCQGVGCTPWRPSGVPWSPPLLRGRCGDNVHCQGVGCTLRCPSGVRLFCVGQCGLPRGRMYALASLPLPRGRMYAPVSLRCPPLLRGTMWTAKGSDARPGIPPVFLGLRRFCVAGVGQRALPRGRMYALASLRCPLVSAAFAWQAWDNVHCQGVGCTPWRPSGVPWSPPLLRGRGGTTCTAKGSDARPGVPPVSLGFRRFCVAGVGQCTLPRGRMHALGSDARPGVPPVSLGLRRCPLVSAAFAWQAWDNVHCQGVGCTPPVSLRCRSGAAPVSLGLRLFCVAGVG